MNKIKSLQVFFNEKKVGTLALMKNNIVAFEYDNEWVNNGFSINGEHATTVNYSRLTPYEC